MLLFPFVCFGQLFPNIPDFKGNLAEITEIGTGKEMKLFGIFKKTYYPGLASGWKYTFEFNENSKLIKRTNSFKDEVKSSCWYQSDRVENRFIERETNSSEGDNRQGDYVEYENFVNAEGQIVQVNYWEYRANENIRERYLVENNTEYQDGRLISFNRQNVDENGEFRNAEKCNLYYNSRGQVARFERINIATGLKTVLSYKYDNKGFMYHYSIDFLIDLVEYNGENQSQEFFYEYDDQGNWTKMYLKTDGKKRLQAKRRIKYRE